MPTLLDPRELLDGALVNGAFDWAAIRNPTYFYQRSALIARAPAASTAGGCASPASIDRARLPLVGRRQGTLRACSRPRLAQQLGARRRHRDDLLVGQLAHRHDAGRARVRARGRAHRRAAVPRRTVGPDRPRRRRRTRSSASATRTSSRPGGRPTRVLGGTTLRDRPAGVRRSRAAPSAPTSARPPRLGDTRLRAVVAMRAVHYLNQFFAGPRRRGGGVRPRRCGSTGAVGPGRGLGARRRRDRRDARLRRRLLRASTRTRPLGAAARLDRRARARRARRAGRPSAPGATATRAASSRARPDGSASRSSPACTRRTPGCSRPRAARTSCRRASSVERHARRAAAASGALARRLAAGESSAAAEEEGYLPRGCGATDVAPATRRRARDRPAAREAGAATVATEIGARVRPTCRRRAPVEILAAALFALVTRGGLRAAGEPRPAAAPSARTALAALLARRRRHARRPARLRVGARRLRHDARERSTRTASCRSTPCARSRTRGGSGASTPFLYTTTGNGTATATAARFGQEIARELQHAGRRRPSC